MTRRTERVGSLLQSTLGEMMLSKLSDPRIDPARTSITRVEVQEDLLAAKVFVSVMGSEAEQRRTLRALGHAAGHIQELLARRIRLRHTPVLDFVLDEKFKQTLQTYELIERAMEEIRQKEAQSAEPPAGTQEPDDQD